MWVIGHDPFMGTEEEVAVNLAQANCIYVEGDTVTEDNGEEKPFWAVKATIITFSEHSEEERKSVIYIADFSTPKEAQEYLADLVKKLNEGERK